MKKMKKRTVSHKKVDALESPIIQLGIVFFMAMAFIVVAYVARYYLPR